MDLQGLNFYENWLPNIDKKPILLYLVIITNITTGSSPVSMKKIVPNRES